MVRGFLSGGEPSHGFDHFVTEVFFEQGKERQDFVDELGIGGSETFHPLVS